MECAARISAWVSSNVMDAVSRTRASLGAQATTSSEQGYVLAQYNLGGCYANGEGVAKDQIEAYAYWNQGTVEYARKKLAALEKQMTAEQIAAGKKRTKELKRELEDKIYENALQKEFAARIAEKPDRK